MNGPQALPLEAQQRQEGVDDKEGYVGAGNHKVAVGDVGEIQDAENQRQADGAEGDDAAEKDAVDD